MKNLMILCFLFITSFAFGQDFVKDYLDEDLEVIEKSNKASYYRYLREDATFSIYKINGKLYMEGKYISTTDQRYDGKIVRFNSRGESIEYNNYKDGVIQKFLITTVDVIKQDYKLIGLVNYSFEFNYYKTKYEDPDVAIAAAKRELIAECKRYGGDAIIGLKIDYLKATEKRDGYALLYGTAIKLK